MKATVSLAVIMSLLVVGCMSTSNFQSWDGPTEYEGDGGAFTTKDGIDIYSAGTPKRKFRILGILGTTTMSSGPMMALYGDSWSASALVKEAKKRGGSAVILVDKSEKFVGFSHNAPTSADRVAVLVKYLD